MNTKPFLKTAGDYACITLIVLAMDLIIYFFQLPNHFVFGGVTGIAVLLSSVTPFRFFTLNLFINALLIAAGFLCIGRKFGLRTIYVTALSALLFGILERVCPLAAPLTGEPLLETIVVIFAIALSSAALFQKDACSGGTDIAAMIIRNYVKIDIGKALLAVDMAAVLFSFSIYGITIGLFSLLGLLCKAFVIDTCIESLNLSKYFTIICTRPEPLCGYIRRELGRGATIYQAQGSYTREKRYIILTAVKRTQAVLLRNFVRSCEPEAFLIITNSSEVVGKGFLLE